MRKRFEILGWVVSLLVVVSALTIDSHRSYLAGNQFRAFGSLALALFLAVILFLSRPKK